jgi:hypothetical protein
MARLVVVVATYNRLPLLRRCLDSIAAHTASEHEVVVVDGGSTDGTREWLRGRSDVTAVLQDELLGVARAYNAVWRGLDCTYTSWLSDDVELASDGLDTAIRELDADAGLGMVGLKMRDTTGPAWKPFGGALSVHGVINMNHGVVRFDLLREVGFFHEGYRSYMVDPDLTAAILSTGSAVAITKSVVLLHHRQEPVQREERASLDSDDHPAKVLYRERFRYLEQEPSRGDRAARALLRLALRGLMARAPADGTRLGFDRRDQWLLPAARFVSPLDPLRTAGRAIHYVQRVPGPLLRRPGNPYRELAARERASAAR